jgi:biopolymer transport protein ExbD
MGMKRRKAAASDEIDITPMIDIVFQLIIFFMVAMSIAMVYGISIKFPPNVKTDDKPKESREKRILVYMGADLFDKDHNILRDGELKINDEVVPLGYSPQNTPDGRKKFFTERREGFKYLRDKMRFLVKEEGYKDDVLAINGDMVTYHGKIMSVVDQGKAAGIKGFSLSPPFK